jgi:hypothetical protein
MITIDLRPSDYSTSTKISTGPNSVDDGLSAKVEILVKNDPYHQPTLNQDLLVKQKGTSGQRFSIKMPSSQLIEELQREDGAADTIDQHRGENLKQKEVEKEARQELSDVKLKMPPEPTDEDVRM